MEINYKNSSNDYKEFFSFKINSLKKERYLIASIILIFIIIGIGMKFNGIMTNRELLKIIIVWGGIGVASIIFFKNIMFSLLKLSLKLILKSEFDLLGEKSLRLSDNKLLYKQLINNEEKIIEIDFFDIKDIVEYKEYIFILTKDKKGYLNFPIIPNDAFESYNIKLDFINEITEKLGNMYVKRI